MESEEMLLYTLKNWRFLNNEIARYKSTIREKSYKITPTLSEAKVFVIGTSTSKVEDYCFFRLKIKEEIERLEKTIKMCNIAYKRANLTDIEKLTINYTCNGKSLRELAKKKNIAQARIYRIRDRAVKKMFLQIQNVANK